MTYDLHIVQRHMDSSQAKGLFGCMYRGPVIPTKAGTKAKQLTGMNVK